MPRTSLVGSTCPQLEQDQRSIPHADRRPAGNQGKSEGSKTGENLQKQQKIEERGR